MDTVYNILYYVILWYSTIALIWGACLLIALIYLHWGWKKASYYVYAMIFSTVLWPYSMYHSMKETLQDMFGKNREE
jgi:hypothetical protein